MTPSNGHPEAEPSARVRQAILDNVAEEIRPAVEYAIDLAAASTSATSDAKPPVAGELYAVLKALDNSNEVRSASARGKIRAALARADGYDPHKGAR